MGNSILLLNIRFLSRCGRKILGRMTWSKLWGGWHQIIGGDISPPSPPGFAPLNDGMISFNYNEHGLFEDFQSINLSFDVFAMHGPPSRGLRQMSSEK